MNRASLLAAALAVLPLAGCGQKAYTRTTAITPAPVQSGNLPLRVAQSPSQLHCGKQGPVWVNRRTHVFHEPGDPYYGHTKRGGYACRSDAVADGYRAAKRR